MRIRRRFLSLVSGCIVALSVTAVPSAQAESKEYVALGASFSAGSGVPSPVAGAPAGCGRSTNNFPRLVAREMGFDLTDMSCGGARTEHLTSSQLAGQPPQFDGLSAGTDLVTFMIGYNDGNVYSGSIADCARPATGSAEILPCELRTAGRYSAAIQATGLAISRALADIRSRAPSARVLVVGYPAVYPSEGNCVPRNPFSPGDTAFLDRLERELNTMLATQADAAGVEFVNAYQAGLGQDSCSPRATRWIEPYSGATGALTLHPNAAGHRGMAATVLAALR